jgi:hypothetical protein
MRNQVIVMKKLYILFILALLTLNITCGGDGSLSSDSSSTTKVTINIGETRIAQSAGNLPSTATTIPSNVATIRFEISAPDIDTIERTVSVAGQESISESFIVPNGSNRHFIAEAYNLNSVLIYKGDTYADLNGTPVNITIVMVSMDQEAPAFTGTKSLEKTSETSILLSWEPAIDNVTPQDKIVYLIYQSTEPFSFSEAADVFTAQVTMEPTYVTDPGATSYPVTGLMPGVPYYFLIRAKDESGNIDTNTDVLSIDLTAPVFAGLTSAIAVSETAIGLTWEPATDDSTPSSEIVYLIYMATTPGGENFAEPSFITSPGVTEYTVRNLMTNRTYYFVVRAIDSEGNVDSNTVEKSAKPLPDLYVSNVFADEYTISFRVNNRGTATVSNIWVVVQYENPYCENFTISIPPGGSIYLSVEDISYTTYIIRVDPENNVPETNETNNTACSGSHCTNPPSLSYCLLL